MLEMSALKLFTVIINSVQITLLYSPTDKYHSFYRNLPPSFNW